MESNSSATVPAPQLDLQEISEICEKFQIQLISPCWDKGDDLVFIFFDWGKVWMTQWAVTAIPRHMGFNVREEIKRTDLNSDLKFAKEVPPWVMEGLNSTVKARLLYMRRQQKEAWEHLQGLLENWPDLEIRSTDKPAQ